MAELNSAIVAIAGVLMGGYFNNFLAEDYKRFRESRSLAGALAGELESHGAAVPLIKKGLENMIMGLAEGRELTLPEWPIPSSPIFEENASKIGLLEPELAKGVAYVYENIRAFRQSFHLLSKNHPSMPKQWSQSIIIACLAVIERAENAGTPLVDGLKRHASTAYLSRPETRRQLKWSAAACVAFLFVVKIL